MFRYSLKNTDTNEIKCVIELQEDIQNPWLEKFEKFGVFQGMRIEPKNFDVIKENIDAEIDAEIAKKEARAAAKLITTDARKALRDIKNSTDLASLKLASRDLAKVVHALVKYLDLVDPREAE